MMMMMMMMITRRNTNNMIIGQRFTLRAIPVLNTEQVIAEKEGDRERERRVSLVSIVDR